MAASRSFLSVLRSIASGYGRLFRTAGAWLAASAVAVAAAAAVVWPLWALATRRRGVFNAAILCAAAAAAIVAVIASLRRKLSTGTSPARIARDAAGFAGLALCVLALLVSGYLCFAYASRGFIPGSILGGAACLGLSGYLFFGRKPKR